MNFFPYRMQQEPYPKVAAIVERLSLTRKAKLDPVEEEYAFHTMYPQLDTPKDTSPFALIVSESESVRDRLISHLFQTEADYHRGPRVFVNSEKIDGDFDCHRLRVKGFQNLRQDELSSIAVRNILRSEVLNEIAVVEGLASHIPDSLTSAAEAIYLAISATSPDLGRDVRSFLARTKSIHNRMRLMVFDADRSKVQLSQLIWAVGKCLHTSELPATFFVDEKSIVDDELISDLRRIPAGMAVTRIVSTRHEARLARAHAYLMSHIKSLLPIFNRQAKQDKVADELSDVIAAVAQKHLIPVNDFPSADYIRERVRSFDFGKLKKMKESSLSLLSEFIDHDLVELLARIPHDMANEELTKLSTSAMGGLSKTPDILFYAPDISSYKTVFEGMSPNKDGVLIGSESLRNHLLSISKLPSSCLYRIWKLSDIDKDGGLNLKEYAICRELMKLVAAGEELPRKLPPIFLGV